MIRFSIKERQKDLQYLTREEISYQEYIYFYPRRRNTPAENDHTRLDNPVDYCRPISTILFSYTLRFYFGFPCYMMANQIMLVHLAFGFLQEINESSTSEVSYYDQSLSA